MLNGSQLNSIGFRYVLDLLELLTPYGAELAAHPKYYSAGECDLLKSEQSNVSALMVCAAEATVRINKLMRLLMPVKDIRRSVERCGEVVLTEVELFELKRFLLQLSLIASAYNELGLELDGINIYALPEALDIVDPDRTGSPSFYVSDRYSPKLAEIRAERRSIDDKLRTVGVLSADELDILRFRRTQLAAEEELENSVIRERISSELRAYSADMLKNIASIGRLDYCLAKARLAVDRKAVIPIVGAAGFDMKCMNDPLFADGLEAKGRGFVPVSLELVPGTTVITGANMGGKSMAIKTLALNAMLAMCGFAVFAKSAELPMLDDIYLLSEDREDAEAGLSSFGGEIKAFDSMLRETESMSSPLVLLDEFARGTNPHEGSSLVKAAAKLFNKRNCAFAVIATHFDGVARLARLHYRVAGLGGVSAEKLIAELKSSNDALAKFMDYGLYPVSPNEEPPRDAVTICRALGIKEEFEELIDV